MSTHDIIIGKPVIISPIITKSPVIINGSSGGSANASALWTGEGPPHLVMGARIGDEYLDTLTGTLYRLDEGI